MNIFELVAKYPDLEELKSFLAAYNILVTENEDRYLLRYDIGCNFKEEFQRQCRGIIFEKGTNQCICYAFDKFFNVGETQAATLAGTLYTNEKIDGSIIKYYFWRGAWHVCTNYTIDARQAINSAGYNFYSLICDGWCHTVQQDKERIDPHNSITRHFNPKYTYIFELVHPYNRIVVWYPTPTMYLIGCRDMDTMKEVDPETVVVYKGTKTVTTLYYITALHTVPPQFRISSIPEAIKVVETLDLTHEGCVVRDAQFNRVKVKSPLYFAAHHIKSNMSIPRHVLALIRLNKADDFLALFPEYTQSVTDMKNQYNHWCSILFRETQALFSQTYSTRKDFALAAKQTSLPGLAFSLYDKKVASIEEFLQQCSDDKLLSWMRVV